jgi:hypothetical protein
VLDWQVTRSHVLTAWIFFWFTRWCVKCVKWFIRVALIIYSQLLEFQRRSIFEVLKITYTYLSWLYFSYICNLQTLHDFSVNIIIDIFAFSTWMAWEFTIFKFTAILKMRVKMLCDYTSQKTAVFIATSLRTLLCHCINCLGIVYRNMSALIVAVCKLI